VELSQTSGTGDPPFAATGVVGALVHVTAAHVVRAEHRMEAGALTGACEQSDTVVRPRSLLSQPE